MPQSETRFTGFSSSGIILPWSHGINTAAGYSVSSIFCIHPVEPPGLVQFLSMTTWRIIPGLGSVVRITTFISHEKAIWRGTTLLRGLTIPPAWNLECPLGIPTKIHLKIIRRSSDIFVRFWHKTLVITRCESDRMSEFPFWKMFKNLSHEFNFDRVYADKNDIEGQQKVRRREKLRNIAISRTTTN